MISKSEFFDVVNECHCSINLDYDHIKYCIEFAEISTRKECAMFLAHLFRGVGKLINERKVETGLINSINSHMDLIKYLAYIDGSKGLYSEDIIDIVDVHTSKLFVAFASAAWFWKSLVPDKSTLVATINAIYGRQSSLALFSDLDWYYTKCYDILRVRD